MGCFLEMPGVKKFRLSRKRMNGQLKVHIPLFSTKQHCRTRHQIWRAEFGIKKQARLTS